MDEQMKAAMLDNLLAGVLASLVSGGTAQKAVSSTPTGRLVHGPGGIFSAPGHDKAVFSALMLPVAGVQSVLPVYPSQDTNPVFAFITGQTASTGTEPEGPCDDPILAGSTKLCETSLPFGFYSRGTQVFDVSAFGRRVNRGELFDYQLMNSPFSGQAPNMAAAIGGASLAAGVNNDVTMAVYNLAVEWTRAFARQLWTGNPAANNKAGGGYKEFWGFPRVINDGMRDYETQVLCPAADSIVRTFGKRVATNASEFYALVCFIMRRLWHRAQRQGLAPAEWEIAMPFSLFYEITEVWPWASRLATITLSSSDLNNLEGERLRDEVNGMRGNLETLQGQYLIIDGRRVTVRIDETIPETSGSNGSFSATVWFIPMTVRGGTRATYMEYFDYRSPGGALEAGRMLSGGDYYYVTDNGRFLWHKKPPTNWCAQMIARMEPRLVCRTPQLGARIDNVLYQPIEHEDSWDPNSEYWKNGGKTSVATPRLYPPSDV